MAWLRPKEISYGCEISAPLVITPIVAALDDGFEIAGQEVVCEQDPVLRGMAPALNLALVRGWHRAATQHASLGSVPKNFWGEAAPLT